MEEKTLYTRGSEGERREWREGHRERERKETEELVERNLQCVCLCEWKIGKEVNEKAAKSEAGRY